MALHPALFDDRVQQDIREHAERLSEVTAALERARTRAEHDPLSVVLDDLVPVEKRLRQAEDTSAMSELLAGVVRLCLDAHDYERLNHELTLAARRRGQLAPALTRIIRTAIGYLPKLASEEDRTTVITMLHAICKGKVRCYAPSPFSFLAKWPDPLCLCEPK